MNRVHQANDTGLVGGILNLLSLRERGRTEQRRQNEGDDGPHKCILPLLDSSHNTPSKDDRGKRDDFVKASIDQHRVRLLARRICCARVTNRGEPQRWHLHRPTGDAWSGALSKTMFGMSWRE